MAFSETHLFKAAACVKCIEALMQGDVRFKMGHDNGGLKCILYTKSGLLVEIDHTTEENVYDAMVWFFDTIDANYTVLEKTDYMNYIDERPIIEDVLGSIPPAGELGGY